MVAGKILNKTTILLALSLTLVFTGCKKKSSFDSDQNSYNLEASRTVESEIRTDAQHWHFSDERICVVFGYGFNNPETVNPIISRLENLYGLDSEGGLILPLVFPEDFRHGGKSYATDLAQILNDETRQFRGVVVLGAPEYTHIALARNQDNWDQNLLYPVIALFPQDDVLGLESTCDIVIDKGVSADLNGEIADSEEQLQNIEDTPEILIQTINYILALGEPLPKDNTVFNYAKQMLPNHELFHYVDPETGLQSINHFVIK